MKGKKVFECKKCGFCCYGEGGIVVSHGEILRIAEYMGTSVDELKSSFLKKNGDKFCIKEEDGKCVFFEENKGCRIHPVKPNICKAWPFLRGNMVDEISFEMAKQYCPGINPEVTYEEFVKEGKRYLMDMNLIEEQEQSADSLKISL